MEQRLKVLMIGWFSSSIRYLHTDMIYLDLVKHLKPFLEITVIIPRFDTYASVVGVEVIDLKSDPLRYINDEPDIDGECESSEYWNKLKIGSCAEFFSLETQTYLNPLYKEDMLSSAMHFADFVSDVVQKSDFDIIHGHGRMSYPAAIVCKKSLNIPLVLQCNVFSSESTPKDLSCLNALEIESLSFADKVVVPSDRCAALLTNQYAIDSTKIVVIPNGVKQCRKSIKKDSGKYATVLLLGRLIDQCGPNYIIDIAKRVIDFVPEVRFIIAGSGDYLSDTIASITPNRILDRFFFTGPLSEVQSEQLLHMTDVYVMPAITEAHGATVLEAIQYNIPCIISQQSGLGKVLHHTLKSDFWDTARMANQIISVLKYEPLRKEMTLQQNADIEELGWHKSAQQVKKAYNEIVH